MTKPFQHERRLQRIAYGALALAILVAAYTIVRGPGRLFGQDIPATYALVALALGAALGIASIVRRAWPLALGAAGLATLAILPAGAVSPGIAGYALGLAYAAALLVFGELIHMMTRYESAHRAVETDGLPEAHLDRVTDEALRTLASRAGYALVVVAAGIALAFLLSVAGPRQWRAALETTSPLGVALASAAILGVGGLIILFRGAKLPWSRAPSSTTQEPASDVE